MIRRPGIGALWARLDRVGADLGALTSVAPPQALTLAPERLLASFGDDGWERFAQFVARTEGATAVPVAEAEADSPRRRTPAPPILPARAPTTGAVAPRHERVAAPATSLGLPGAPAVVRLPLAASARAPAAAAPAAPAAVTALPSAPRSGSTNRVAASVAPRALQWQPAPDPDLVRDDLAAWAGLAPDDRLRPTFTPGDRSPRMADVLAPTTADIDAPARRTVPPSSLVPGAGTPGFASVPGPASSTVPQRVGGSAESLVSRAPGFTGAGSQLSRLVDLWRAPEAPAPATTTPTLHSAESRIDAPLPAPNAVPAPAFGIAARRAMPEPDPAANSGLPEASVDDLQRHLSDLLEQVLVQAVERQGLTVEDT